MEKHPFYPDSDIYKELHDEYTSLIEYVNALQDYDHQKLQDIANILNRILLYAAAYDSTVAFALHRSMLESLNTVAEQCFNEMIIRIEGDEKSD